MDAEIVGASVWEQAVYKHLLEHVEAEQAIIQRYRDAAETSESPAFAYLARLILEDEQRHHRLMQDLAESLKRFAELASKAEPIPRLDRPRQREMLLALTEELLDVEKADRRETARLRKDLKVVGTTTLWQLIVKLIEHDTEKHIEILEFTRSWLREG